MLGDGLPASDAKPDDAAPGDLGAGSPPCTASAFSLDMNARDLELEPFSASREPCLEWLEANGAPATMPGPENCTLLLP